MFRITEKELAELQQNDERYIGKSMARIFIDEYIAYWQRVGVPADWSNADLDADLKKCAQYFLNRSYRDLIVVFFPDNSVLKIARDGRLKGFYDYRDLNNREIKTEAFYFDDVLDDAWLLYMPSHC